MSKSTNDQNEQAAFMAKVEEIPIMINYVVETAKPSGIFGKRLMHLELAMEEILVNIVNYAYEISPGEILIKTICADKKFQVEIIDNGRYFDPLSLDVPDINAKLDERPIGGLGIMLVRNIIDEVHYLREGDRNKILLVVYLNQ